MIGAVLGNYRLIEQIGDGGMGKVFLAEHTLLGRRAAIKILHPEHAVRQDIVQRFFNEARVASSIQDPGIVEVFDFGIEDGNAYIVMEYLDGESLVQRLERVGCVAPADALRLIYQIAMSLHHAHARGVVHRDLKPDNVVVVVDPAVPGGERTKVLDFGIAKLADPTSSGVRTETGTLIGTPVYMSPEQCRGTATGVDHRSDIYSLGCVLFHLICGRPPFEGEGAGSLIVMHVRDEPPVPSSLAPVSPEIDTIILRCLAKDPADRFQTMHELAEAVDRLLRVESPGRGAAFETSVPRPATFVKYPTTLSTASGETVRLQAGPEPVTPAPAPPRRARGIAVAIGSVLLIGAAVAAIVVMTAPPEPAIATTPTTTPTPATSPAATALPTPPPATTTPSSAATPERPPPARPAGDEVAEDRTGSGSAEAGSAEADSADTETATETKPTTRHRATHRPHPRVHRPAADDPYAER